MDIIEKEKKKRTILYGLLVTVLVLIGVTYAYYRITKTQTNSNVIGTRTCLNTTLTEDLINEGLARELVSKVQNMRKEKDFNIEDRINLFYNGNSYFESVLKEFESYIKEETLALSLIKKEDLTNLVKLNDLDVYLDIEKR